MSATLQEIYEPEAEDQSETPLVLIHDGGGTIFQYYMLSYLGRRTYGIASPYFESGKKPEGGLPELAQEYAAVIQESVKAQSIILGGWSFGGIISIEIARLLQGTSTAPEVIGILMIDSPCPWAGGSWKSAKSIPTFRETTSERMKSLTLQSLTNAREMIATWGKPDCTPPPTIMIRAQEASKHLANDDGQLGWSTLEELKMVKVVDVPGDHFSMFADDKVDGLSEEIKEACRSLESHKPS